MRKQGLKKTQTVTVANVQIGFSGETQGIVTFEVGTTKAVVPVKITPEVVSSEDRRKLMREVALQAITEYFTSHNITLPEKVEEVIDASFKERYEAEVLYNPKIYPEDIPELEKIAKEKENV